MLLIVNVVNFGAMIFAWISVANAARTGAQYLTTAGISVSGGGLPSAATIQTMVAADLASLPNQSSIQVCVSTTDVSCNKGTAPAGTPPTAEPAEGSPAVTYLMGAVDVTYTFVPLIPVWDFPTLHIHATLPPTTVHRQAKMRILQ